MSIIKAILTAIGALALFGLWVVLLLAILCWVAFRYPGRLLKHWPEIHPQEPNTTMRNLLRHH